jgi:hypothetical protein
MPDMDLGALTIPIFASIFGAGWGACYTVLVLPMKERVTKLESRMADIEKAKDERIQNLERKLGIS